MMEETKMGVKTLSALHTTASGGTEDEHTMDSNPTMDSCSSLAALGGGLGGLCAILAILLVGVAMGWVWTCHKKTRKFELQER